MVLLVLGFKCRLENVSCVEFPISVPFTFTVKDPVGCEVRENVVVDPCDVSPVEGGRGEAHFVVKFEGQMKQSSIVIVDDAKKCTGKFDEKDEEKGEFVPIRAFECRNVDVLDWDRFSGGGDECGVKVISKGGTTFEQVKLDDDWFEYCEKCGESVSVTEIEFEFARS